METKKDNLKKVKDNQADEPPLSETESKNASDDALPSETAEKSKEKAKSEKPKKKKGKKSAVARQIVDNYVDSVIRIQHFVRIGRCQSDTQNDIHSIYSYIGNRTYQYYCRYYRRCRNILRHSALSCYGSPKGKGRENGGKNRQKQGRGQLCLL